MSGGGHTIESPGGLLTPNDLEGKFACPVAAWLSSCSIEVGQLGCTRLSLRGNTGEQPASHGMLAMYLLRAPPRCRCRSSAHAPAHAALPCSLSPVGSSAGRPHRSLTRPTLPALLRLLGHADARSRDQDLRHAPARRALAPEEGDFGSLRGGCSCVAAFSSGTSQVAESQHTSKPSELDPC